MSDPSVISDFWGISDSKTGKYVGIPIKIEPPVIPSKGTGGHFHTSASSVELFIIVASSGEK